MSTERGYDPAGPFPRDKIGGIGYYPQSWLTPSESEREVLQLNSDSQPPYSLPWPVYVFHIIVSADATRGWITYECD